MIDVGAAAGLNLCLDQFHYEYGDLSIGDTNATVQLKCNPVGPLLPPNFDHVPNIASRVGVDISPIDIDDIDDIDDIEEVNRLIAYTWLDQSQVVKPLYAATQVARQVRPRVVRSDATALLPFLLSKTNPHSVPC